jgi:hypothetical protein
MPMGWGSCSIITSTKLDVALVHLPQENNFMCICCWACTLEAMGFVRTKILGCL